MNDPVLRYLGMNTALGVRAGLVFSLSLLVTDTLGVRSLISSSEDVVSAIGILFFGSITTFVPLVVATAVGVLRDSND